MKNAIKYKNINKSVFSMEKTVPAKIVFAGWFFPPGKNPAKLALQTFSRWKK
jgi:hypothetical protein